MPTSFDILRPLESDSASNLFLALDKKSAQECRLRRFKARKAEEIEGLKELFTQLSGIDSPHLQKLVDFGTDKEGFYTVTAGPLEGETLETILERGPLTMEEFEVVARQLLEVLDVLHEQAIVHGSLRSDYVRITGKDAANWRVTLEGFGQGFAVRGDSKEAQVRAYRCTAPEQWQDGTTRRRTDVYALGCVLYEALTARSPFDGKTLKELRLKHTGHDLPPLHKLAAHAPPWICAWVMHLLAADPEQRPRKAAAAREAFERKEAPALPELPSQHGVKPLTASTPLVAFPMQRPQPQPGSEPVLLPTAQPVTLNVTSSTIPIATGPHIASRMPQRPGTKVIQRKNFTPPRKPPSAVSKNKKPIIIAAAAIVLMLAFFVLPRCGQQPPPPKIKGKTEQKRR
ncbi:MAG: protein kinase [Verrucomicrobiaceae bacterium]